jgi:hypothetical protein
MCTTSVADAAPLEILIPKGFGLFDVKTVVIKARAIVRCLGVRIVADTPYGVSFSHYLI